MYCFRIPNRLLESYASKSSHQLCTALGTNVSIPVKACSKIFFSISTFFHQHVFLKFWIIKLNMYNPHKLQGNYNFNISFRKTDYSVHQVLTKNLRNCYQNSWFLLGSVIKLHYCIWTAQLVRQQKLFNILLTVGDFVWIIFGKYVMKGFIVCGKHG